MIEGWQGWLNAALNLVQHGGIVSGIFFTAFSMRDSARSRHVENLIHLTEGHRDLWRYYLERPELSRVLDEEVDLQALPVTRFEEWFVRFLINHIIITFQAHRLRQFREPEKLHADIRELFSLPIPNAVWIKAREMMDSEFIRFVDSLMKPPLPK